ncbi:MAG TPA: C40 family peptidase [Chitinophagaceae bacterium]|nr:C40 family peptidase [Chitinophagaceae bacterium]
MVGDPQFGICQVPVLPVRAVPGHAAEMVTELIFGECFIILKRGPDHWLRIRTAEDGYEGWCSVRNPLLVDESFFRMKDEPLAGDWVNPVMVETTSIMAPLGSRLKGLQNGKAVWGSTRIFFSGPLIVRNPEKTISPDRLREYAFLFLGSGYLWGGKSVFGLDCSGFTQSVYRLVGRYIYRDAWQQSTLGEKVSSLDQANLGDLAFFNSDRGKPTHVGLLLGPNEIIHAAGTVRLDPVDAQGIIHAITGERSHLLTGIRRLFD